MSDARGPSRKGAAATAFTLMLACVPAHELSSYSRGSGLGGDAPTSLGGAGGAGLGSGGLPGGSGGAAGTPSPDSGTPSEGGAGGAGSSPPPPLPDAGGSPAA